MSHYHFFVKVSVTSKSSFSKKIKTTRDEIVPAVSPIGYALKNIRDHDPLRQLVKSDTRLPWEMLFFQSDFENSLTKESAGNYAEPLEMLRLAPSGHNYQPWRIVRDRPSFHFYIQRTQKYGPGSPMFTLLGVADLQRIEIGIAMCHFELTAREIGLMGNWKMKEPIIRKSDNTAEYVITWVGS